MESFTPTRIFGGAADQARVATRSQPATTGGALDMRVLGLLTARLCHELSEPVAAINNGVELLVEEHAGFTADAAALVSDSARRAGSRLQFYRFAYGFSGSALVGAAPHELAIALFDPSPIACEYPEDVRILSPNWQKLACNLLSVGAEALPRGGRLVLASRPLSLEAIGEAAALSPEARAALTLAIPIAELTSRTVQAYFTGLLAKTLGCRLVGTAEPGRVRLTAIAGGA
jgi:histidine phosphotransferase ChpT